MIEFLERKLENDEEFKNIYQTAINQYIEQSHATKIYSDNRMPITPYPNYVPHPRAC